MPNPTPISNPLASLWLSSANIWLLHPIIFYCGCEHLLLLSKIDWYCWSCVFIASCHCWLCFYFTTRSTIHPHWLLLYNIFWPLWRWNCDSYGRCWWHGEWRMTNGCGKRRDVYILTIAAVVWGKAKGTVSKEIQAWDK